MKNLCALTMAMAFFASVFVCFFGGYDWRWVDTFAYFRQADAILLGGWLTSFPNGYPLLVALASLGFGDARETALIAMNMVMATGIVGMVVILAKERTGSNGLAVCAGMLCAFWPQQLIHVRALTSEVPSAFFITFGVAFFCLGKDFVGGGGVALAALCRPTLLPVAVVLGGAIALRGYLKRAVIILMIPMGVFASTKLYGYVATGEWKSSENLARTLLLGLHDLEAGKERFQYRGESTSEAVQIYLDDAMSDPTAWLQRLGNRFLEMWGPWPNRLHGKDGGTARGTAKTLLLGLQFFVLCLGVYALILRRDLLSFAIFAPTLVLSVVHVAIFAVPRYNYPATPLLIVLAIDGIGLLWARFGAPRIAITPQKRQHTKHVLHSRSTEGS